MDLFIFLIKIKEELLINRLKNIKEINLFNDFFEFKKGMELKQYGEFKIYVNNLLYSVRFWINFKNLLYCEPNRNKALDYFVEAISLNEELDLLELISFDNYTFFNLIQNAYTIEEITYLTFLGEVTVDSPSIEEIEEDILNNFLIIESFIRLNIEDFPLIIIQRDGHLKIPNISSIQYLDQVLSRN